MTRSTTGSSRWWAGRVRLDRGLRIDKKSGNRRARWWCRNTQASYRIMSLELTQHRVSKS
jgi:hypothetical protein